MKNRFAATLGVLTLAVTALSARLEQATGAGQPFAAAPVSMTSPARVGSGQPNLTVDGRGRVWMSWLEPAAPAGLQFRVAPLGPNGTWGPAGTIVTSEKLLANWADFPSIFAASNGTLAAHWLERGATRAAYAIRVATSANDGKTWTAAVAPHRDDSATEHGFVTFYEMPGGGIGLVWLDGREMAAGHAATGHGGAMALRSAPILKDGTAGAETVIDARVCDCCQTSATRTADGVIVAYRDRSDKEIRDIAVSRLDKGVWSPALTIGADNWEINGCPVNGPAIAANGRTVAVAWFAAVNNAPKTQIAFSSDSGRTFGAPVRVDAAPTVGRVDLVMLGPDRALVSSIERADKSANVVVREVRRDGTTSAPVAVAPVSPERPSGFPRMVLAGDRLIIAWTEITPGQPSQVRVAQARIRP